MKKIVLLSISLIIFACNSKTKEPIVDEGFELKPIPFLNKNVYLPEDFKKVNINELGEMIRQNPNGNPLNEHYYKMAVSVYSSTNIAPVLYAQENDDTNNVWFIPGKYTPLDQELMDVYENMIDESFLSRSEDSGVRYEKLDSDLLQFGEAKAITLKYKQSHEDQIKYLTQYIITKNLETFSVITLNSEDKDFSPMIKSL